MLASGEAFVFLFSSYRLVRSPCIVGEFSLFLISFCNYGEDSSSFSCTFILFNTILFIDQKKKKKRETFSLNHVNSNELPKIIVISCFNK